MATIPVYADGDDLAAWMGLDDPPDGATPKLRSAAIAVRKATLLAVYAVDTAGLPTNTDVLDAFRDATCAQAAALITAGIDTLGGPAAATGPVTAQSIGTASITYATAATTADTRAALAAGHLTAEAMDILRAAGLLYSDGSAAERPYLP